MTTSANQMNITDNESNNDNSMVDSVKVLSEFTRKDIEKSYNLDTIKGTEAYFSNRYGWTLRRTID
jgi:hypothetical protein|tara:strand:- start:1026 stop:1223 length:198 start_codon:yes stop_codon:yes gene_type:complete